MRLFFFLCAFISFQALANTNHSSTKTPPLNESDVFHNSPFGLSEDMPQERQEEAPEWITPQAQRLEETKPNERVNEWRQQSVPPTNAGEE